MTLRVDLHLHSTASDGQLSPSEVVQLARARRMDVIALTDHDTTAGIAEAQQAAGGQLIVLPGIELSAEDARRDVHLLGYLINPQEDSLQAQLAYFRQERLRRAERIAGRLAELGRPIAWEQVLSQAGGGAVGRPHIARVMVEAGYVDSVDQAFDQYLHNGGPAYVWRQRLSPEAAITLIHSAGGAAVLAHPGSLPDYAAVIERLVPAGLDGIEVIHPKNTELVRENLRALALRYGLITTGGSDFHGPDTEPIGAVTPPPGCVDALRQRVARYRAG